MLENFMSFALGVGCTITGVQLHAALRSHREGVIMEHLRTWSIAKLTREQLIAELEKRQHTDRSEYR